MSIRKFSSRKSIIVMIALIVITIIVAACGGQATTIQETLKERNNVLGQRDVASVFAEALQIMNIEAWKDDPNKIVNLYLFDPVKGGLLIPPIQCQGVPVSSTESLEPNEGGADWGRISGGDAWYEPFLVPVDGADIMTYEQAGKDGTYGDPVAFRACLDYSGNYYDFPALGVPYLVTSASYTFPNPTVERDIETELKIKQLEIVLENGGCVDTNTLSEVDCSTQAPIAPTETITN